MKFSAQLQFFSHVTFLDKFLFTKHLSMMLKSGITIVEALGILIKQTKSEAFKQVVLSISNEIKNGKSLAKSLRMHPKIFNSLYVSLIEVGEESGKLDENLSYLANQLSKEYKFRQKLKGALMYPMIVLIAAGIIAISMSLFVLPKLIDLFQGFSVDLPLSTKILLAFATLMKNFGIFIVALFIGMIVLLRYLIMLPGIRPLKDKVLLSIPVSGTIIQNAELAIFCRSLGLMIQSGLPITSALDIETTITTNTVFKQYVQQMLTAITKGKSLSEELDKGDYKKIPLLATKMIAVGEQTGKLDETLLYLGEFFEEAVDDATKNITTIMEPVMLLIIGLVVAFVALSIISPIYQLTGSIKK